jgi:uncharacterized membrane protein
MRRILTLDLVRTLAIVLMVIYHFIYDLRFFGYFETTIPEGPEWKFFRAIILSLFITCVGAGLVLAQAQGFHLKKFLRRVVEIALGALAVTLVSVQMFPDTWIHFGILHFIAVATLVVAPFARYPKLALVAGLTIIGVYALGWVGTWWPFNHLQAWVPRYSVDYVPLFPWLGAAFLGVALGHSPLVQSDPLKTLPAAEHLAKPGQRSLLIYLLHQPILFALLWSGGQVASLLG